LIEELTQKKLKEVLEYNPKNRDFVWRVAVAKRVAVGDVAGSKRPDGYIQIRVFGKDYLAHRLAWFYIHGYFPENGLDHKNRIRGDNRIGNLREVSQQCNLRNTGNPENNKSGVKGICWHTAGKKWHAKIKVNGKQKYLGLFDDFTEATAHRLAAEQCLNWSSCDSSSPAYKYIQNYLKDLKGE